MILRNLQHTAAPDHIDPAVSQVNSQAPVLMQKQSCKRTIDSFGPYCLLVFSDLSIGLT